MAVSAAEVARRLAHNTNDALARIRITGRTRHPRHIRPRGGVVRCRRVGGALRPHAATDGANTVEDALASGARIGSYEVIDRLGAGGMGEVYRARDTRLGRTVAIKVLRSGADPQLLQRLDREARAASALNHPNIVHIYDVGEAAGRARRALRGHGAASRARRCGGGCGRVRCRSREVLDLGAQLADGLAKAHRAGHRPSRPQAREPDGHAGRAC